MTKRRRRITGSDRTAINIGRLLDERGMKASHLDEELDLREGATSRWLKGGGIFEDHLIALCRFFKTTPAWVLYNDGPMHVTEPNVGGVDALEAQAQAARDRPDEEDRQVPRARA